MPSVVRFNVAPCRFVLDKPNWNEGASSSGLWQKIINGLWFPQKETKLSSPAEKPYEEAESKQKQSISGECETFAEEERCRQGMRKAENYHLCRNKQCGERAAARRRGLYYDAR